MNQKIIIFCIAASTKVFIDAIVVGGGLVQTSTTVITLP